MSIPVRNNDNEIVGYTLNQESVDLNSYLYAEKALLMSMAEMLGYTKTLPIRKGSGIRTRYINANMFDEETGFYYDLQTNEDGSAKRNCWSTAAKELRAGSRCGQSSPRRKRLRALPKTC